jgi:hypothetical protein
MARIFVTLILGCLSLAPAFGATTTAAAPAYEIEVLIFEARLPEWEGAEVWTRDTTVAIDTSQATSAGATPADSALVNAAAALQADKRFRVLLHKRWVQTTEAKATANAVQLGNDAKELDGLLKFYVNRFLHVELNLAFRSAASGGETGPVYQINEQRRIKSQELHYFDHPKFGALVRVVPVSG